MSEKSRDDVLKKMLKTPPQPKKGSGGAGKAKEGRWVKTGIKIGHDGRVANTAKKKPAK